MQRGCTSGDGSLYATPFANNADFVNVNSFGPVSRQTTPYLKHRPRARGYGVNQMATRFKDYHDKYTNLRLERTPEGVLTATFHTRGGAHIHNGAALTQFTHAFGDIANKVENPGSRPSLSLHVYGCDIGSQRRRKYDLDTGAIEWYVTPHDSIALPRSA